MDQRTAYIGYWEELAKRNVDIQHRPASKATTHFFLELDYEKIMGYTEPNNLGWNLVLMGYETQMDDNHHGRQVEKVICIFDVLKHCKADDPALLQATYTQAREIGDELLARLKEHQKNPCDAFADDELTAGITIPYSTVWNSKRSMEVGPRWNNYFGYRFTVDILMDEFVKSASDNAKWGDPA